MDGNHLKFLHDVCGNRKAVCDCQRIYRSLNIDDVVPDVCCDQLHQCLWRKCIDEFSSCHTDVTSFIQVAFVFNGT